LFDGVRMCSAWTSTKLLIILYMNVALALALRCSSDSHCNLEIIDATAYTTLVRPSIEYASSVWDPYTRNNIHQLEAIQRRAARFVCNNFYDRVVTSMHDG
jgi:hypothetical protein